jgi:ribulose-5-phosphate 4-epimerase/fuculose-1-phosphate aldolase
VEFAEKTRPGRYRALLMLSHGVFTSGKTPADAVKAAVIVEHSAKVAYLTELLGKPKPLAPEEVEKLHRRYVSRYGQRKEGDG